MTALAMAAEVGLAASFLRVGTTVSAKDLVCPMKSEAPLLLPEIELELSEFRPKLRPKSIALLTLTIFLVLVAGAGLAA